MCIGRKGTYSPVFLQEAPCGYCSFHPGLESILAAPMIVDPSLRQAECQDTGRSIIALYRGSGRSVCSPKLP